MKSKGLILMILLSLVTLSFIGMAEIAHDDVIGEVNGKPIYRGGVWWPVALIELQNPEVSGADLTQLDMENAVTRLHNQIRRILQEEAIDSLGLTADPETVESILQERISRLVESTGKSLEENLALFQRKYLVVDALREAQANPGVLEHIFEEKLEPAGIDEDTWDLYVAIYLETPARINELEEKIPKTVEEMMDYTRGGIRRHLQYTMLDEYFMGDVNVAVENSPALLESRRAAFLLNALENAEVVIHDENLIGAVDVMKDELVKKASGS